MFTTVQHGMSFGVMPVVENVHYRATCMSFGVMQVVENVHCNTTGMSFGVMSVLEFQQFLEGYVTRY